MAINVRMILQPPLDSLANNAEDEQEIGNNCTVYGALSDICESYPRLREQLFQGEELSPFIHIFLNGDLIPSERCKDKHLAEQDELCLLTAIRGG